MSFPVPEDLALHVDVDAAAVAFIALALLARGTDRPAWTGVALGCATLAKLWPVVLLPALWRRWDWKLPAALLALYLQPTTLIGLVGLAVWAVGVLGLPWLTDQNVPRGRKLMVVGIALVGLVAVLLAGISLGLWDIFRTTPLFNQKSQDRFWYYHAFYSLFYPSLWPLTGILGLAAIVAWPRPALFALVTFAVSFLLNSMAASKSLRYIVYAQPLLFMVWGMGLAALWPALWSFLCGLQARLAPPLAALGPRRRGGGGPALREIGRAHV